MLSHHIIVVLGRLHMIHAKSWSFKAVAQLGQFLDGLYWGYNFPAFYSSSALYSSLVVSVFQLLIPCILKISVSPLSCMMLGFS